MWQNAWQKQLRGRKANFWFTVLESTCPHGRGGSIFMVIRSPHIMARSGNREGVTETKDMSPVIFGSNPPLKSSRAPPNTTSIWGTRFKTSLEGRTFCIQDIWGWWSLWCCSNLTLWYIDCNLWIYWASFIAILRWIQLAGCRLECLVRGGA